MKKFFNSVKAGFISRPKSEQRILIFCFVIFACLVLYLIISAIDTAVSGNYFFIGSTVFFQHVGDAFMDFFNVNYFVQDMDPYIGSGSSYPPMVLLFAKIFQLIQGSAESAKVIQSSARGIISLLIYFGIFLVCSWFLLRVFFKRKNISLLCNILLYIALFFSAPMLFAIDRGNYLIYAFLFVGYFLLYYKSEKRWQRELSYVSLALAVSFKIYPAIFALLLFNKKDWLNLVKTACYSILLLILPIFVFEGTFSSNLKYFLDNLLGFQSQEGGYYMGDVWYLNGYYNAVSLSGIVHILCARVSGVPIAELPSYVGTIANVFAILLAAFCIAAFFMVNKNWIKVFLLTSVMTFILNTNYEYNLIFFVYSLLMYLTDEEAAVEENKSGKRKAIYNIVYGVLLTLIFIPLPMGYFIPKMSLSLQHGYPVLDLVQVISYIALTIIIVINVLKEFVIKRRNIKQNAEEVKPVSTVE